MENKIDNLSFKANITTLTKIKNKAAFTEVKKLFMKSTKDNAKDVLIISDSSMGESIIQLSHIKNGRYIDYDSVDIVLRDINKQIDSMGAKEFSKKLVSAFKVLKFHEETSEIIEKLKSEISRAQLILKTNQRISWFCKLEGKSNIAKRHDVLASMNQERITKLSEKMNAQIETFNKKLETFSDKYKEFSILQLKKQ